MERILVWLVFTIAFVAANSNSTSDSRRRLEEDIAACKASESPTQADMDAFNNNQAPTTLAGKCFVGCMFEKMGFVVNGVFSRAAADAHARQSMAANPSMLAVVLKGNQACEPEVAAETNKCVTGPKLMQCLEKQLPARPDP